MNNIIFLDIDGVLNSMPYFNTNKGKKEPLNEFNVKILSQIYHTTECKLVLTSTWRELKNSNDNEYRKMYQYLEDTLAKQNIKTDDFIPTINFNRPLEIKTWLDKHNEITHYVILDDDFTPKEYKKYELEKHLIQTTYFCKSIEEGGLQQHHVNQDIKLLKIKQ